MITLKCKRCDCSLNRGPGVGLVDTLSGDLGGTYDICPEAPGGLDDPHVAQRLMIVTVSAKVAVDADAWTLAYGTPTDEIAGDARDYTLERMRGMITDEMQIRDVSVKEA